MRSVVGVGDGDGGICYGWDRGLQPAVSEPARVRPPAHHEVLLGAVAVDLRTVVGDVVPQAARLGCAVQHGRLRVLGLVAVQLAAPGARTRSVAHERVASGLLHLHDVLAERVLEKGTGLVTTNGDEFRHYVPARASTAHASHAPGDGPSCARSTARRGCQPCLEGDGWVSK